VNQWLMIILSFQPEAALSPIIKVEGISRKYLTPMVSERGNDKMFRKKIDVEEIHGKVSIAAGKLHARQAWLFGSYARGEATEHSDVDILFVVDGAASHHDLIRAARKLMRDWRVPKDVLVYRSEEFKDWQKVVGSLCYRVKREGVCLYEA